MKKILFLILISLITNSKAQVVFEHRYDSAGAAALASQLMIINFEVSGQQYVKVNEWGKLISIYNLNHSLVKNISYAGFPQSANNESTILYLSQLLFNTDSLIEFMYIAGNPAATSIYSENGVLIFTDPGVPSININVPENQYPIYNTSLGTKMILSYADGHSNVFGLSGTLTTAIDRTSHSFTANIGNAYPNPTNQSTTIEYKLPDNINHGEIIFYDLQGTEIKRFKVDKTFNSLLISTSDIPAGTYYYQMQTSGNASAGKKLVVIK